MTERINLRPALSRRRIWLAFTVAIAADGIQLLLGPFGWAFFDETVDVAAMVLLSMLVRFHPLFLPTFVAEFFPVVDMLPTWTACTALVIAMRRKQQTPPASSQTPPGVIDI